MGNHRVTVMLQGYRIDRKSVVVRALEYIVQ
jgi:hypothetical protein